MMKFKCDKCGAVTEAETNPGTCTACNEGTMQEVTAAPEETTTTEGEEAAQ